MKCGYWLICFFFISCSNKADNVDHQQHTVKMRVKDTVTEWYYMNDTIILSTDEYTVDYYGRKNGMYIHSDMITGVVQKKFYVKDTLCGSEIQYYSNGKPHVYVCHDSYGDSMLYREYDSVGNIKSEKGDFYSPCIISDVYFKSKHILIVYSNITNAPYTSYAVDNYLLYNKDTLRPYMDKLNHEWEHKYYFNTPSLGSYEYKEVYKVVDSIKHNTYVYKKSAGPITRM